MPRRLLVRLLASAPRATDHIPDVELLRRFVASGDAAAFELVVRRHANAVWTACRRLLRSDADADDAFQATFLALIRKARNVRTASAGGWLHRVAVRTALALRERAGRMSPVESLQLGDVPAPVVPEPDAERAAVLHEELALLPERERLPLVLCDLEGLSHADAATALGWPIGTVSSRLSRARAKLRDRLARRGLSPTAALLPALAAPPRVVPTALSLTAGAPPAVVSLTEGVLAMMAKTTSWAWAAVACAGVIGVGSIFAFAPGGEMPLAPAPAEGAPAPRKPGIPTPAAEPVPPAKDDANEEWLPKPEGKTRVPNPGGNKQRPTAFPELALPTRDGVDPGGAKYEAEIDKLCSRLIGTTKLVVDPTDNTLRKLLKARLAEGVSEIRFVRQRMRTGVWSPDSRLELFGCLADMQATLMELWGEQPKELIPWLEELVIIAKYMERFFWARSEIGTDPPGVLEAARRHRFGVESALWKAKLRA